MKLRCVKSGDANHFTLNAEYPVLSSIESRKQGGEAAYAVETNGGIKVSVVLDGMIWGFEIIE